MDFVPQWWFHTGSMVWYQYFHYCSCFTLDKHRCMAVAVLRIFNANGIWIPHDSSVLRVGDTEVTAS